MTQTVSMVNIPGHVPAEAVRDCRLFDRKTVYENPYETIIPAIHDGPSVFYTHQPFPGPVPGWVVRRNADLRAIYNDTENFYKQGNTRFAEMIGESWDAIPTELDPPRHTGFRNALNPIFSPRNMAALDGRVRERARHFIDKFRNDGGCNFVEQFAIPFPVTIFLDLLGLPQEEMAQYLVWEGHILHGTDQETRITSVRAVKTCLLEAIEQRRKNPTDDLISNALTLEVDGRKWTSEEVFGHCFNLYIGGLDTVTSNIGLHFHHLATHPEDQADLRAHPDKTIVAIEELLRAYAAVSTARICRNPYTLGGYTFMPGDYISMSTPLAGRDPEEYESPNEIRLDRKPTHVTLGYGIHRCLGQHLARRELQIAMQEFLSEIPTFGLKPGFKVPFYVGNIVHAEELQLVW
jgi:cytochrome P450